MLTPAGISFSIAVLQEARAQLLTYNTDGLSAMQRLLLTIISRSHRYAVAATGDRLEPGLIKVSVSGLGLAVPSVSATVYLCDVTGEPVAAVCYPLRAQSPLLHV